MVLFSVFILNLTKNKINSNIYSDHLTKDLNPWFITGFCGGEGSFSLRLRLRGKKYYFIPVFSIGAQINQENKILLEKIKAYFYDVGSISKSGNML